MSDDVHYQTKKTVSKFSYLKVCPAFNPKRNAFCFVFINPNFISCLIILCQKVVFHRFFSTRSVLISAVQKVTDMFKTSLKKIVTFWSNNNNRLYFQKVTHLAIQASLHISFVF